MRLPFRTRWILTTLFVVLSVAVVAVWYWSKPAPHHVDCLPTGGPRTATTEPVPAPTDAITIVEKGFTQDDWQVLLGGVLENTSSLVAYRLPVTFRVVDAAGNSIVEPDSLAGMRQEIPVLLPGQRIGVGAIAKVVSDENTFDWETAAGFDLTFGTAQWWPADGKNPAFAEVTTRLTPTDVEYPSPVSESPSELELTTYSPYCDPLVDRGRVFLFRDSDGTLLGGALYLLPNGLYQTAPPSTRRWLQCDSGTSRAFPVNFGPNLDPAVDVSRTEAFVYCDFEEPQGYDPSSATAPRN